MFSGTHYHFWVRFPHSREELALLSKWADECLLKPRVADVLTMNEENVRFVFEKLLERRVVGKYVLKVSDD